VRNGGRSAVIRDDELVRAQVAAGAQHAQDGRHAASLPLAAGIQHKELKNVHGFQRAEYAFIQLIGLFFGVEMR